MRSLRAVVAIVAVVAAGPAGVAHADPVAPDRPGQGWLPPTPDQWPLVVDESTTRPERITRGVQHYADFLHTVGGAQQAQVLDVDLTDPNLRLGVVESHDHLTDTADEVPTSMAHRTGAVAGVNGDFFEIYGSGRPLGMVVINGRLVKTPNAGWPAELWVHRDGTIAMGTETYTGTVSDDTQHVTHAITSVNTVADLSGDALVRVTPDLGTPSPIPASTVLAGHLDPHDPNRMIVDSVRTGVTDLAQLPAGGQDLVGSGLTATWLARTAHPGDQLTITERLGPDADVRQALSGGAILVKDGAMAVPSQGPGENNQDNPVTAVGVTRDGRHAVFAVFDGHQPEDVAQGLTRPQIAGWMMRHGAYDAILFDSGGSAQMVGRLPGRTEASVLNTPSDGHERPVANGLFLYSTESAPGPAAGAVVNDGRPLTALAGGTITVPAYATDRLGNPAAEPVRLSVSPPDLAAVRGNTLVLDRAGHGALTVRAGRAVATVPLTVLSGLHGLTVSPARVDLGSGATQQLSVTATGNDARPVTLPMSAVHWAVDPANLGTVDASGLFTAAKSGSGMVTVTASAGGAHGTSSIAVGQTAQPVDALTDLSTWSITDRYLNVYPRTVPSPGSHTTSDGSLSFDAGTKANPGDAGSFDVHYDYPAQSKTFDLSVYLNDPDSEQIPLRNGTQAPVGIGLWVKGNPDLASRPGSALAPGIVTLNVGIWQSTDQPTSFYPTGVTFDGWRYVVAALPPGLEYPLRINYLGLVVIKPGPNLTGDVHLADLQALYSPRPPTTIPYVPIPHNPDWLRFTDVGSFAPGGGTLAALDDAHLSADAPAATGSVDMKALPTMLGALPRDAKPQAVQAIGDMSDSGTRRNLDYAKGLLDGLGVPYHDAPGNHEITQGADPENVDFTSVFGPTHYAYDVGAARVLVTDSAHIGILASDPFQVPDDGESQYRWLAGELSANTKKVAIVVTHVPAYDPHPRADSQFADRWEASMYERLVQRYQQTHPDKHVLLLFGHARGFAENLLAPDGTNRVDGIPNFVVADAGSPPYAPADQGGFYHYALFHVRPDGTVQFAVQPLLASIAVSAPRPSLPRGGRERLTATGTSTTGDDAPALQVPVADPVSRTWTSSDPRVASIDPATGLLTARRPGTITVTVTAGGITGTTTVTVTG